jgi:two-component system phosphate regulon sensor histidine kinase PhoR
MMLAGVLVGGALHRSELFLVLLLGGYGGWHVSQVIRLLRWLQRDAQSRFDAAPPESWGLWALVFNALYQRQRLFRAERERLRTAARTVREIASAMSDAVVMVDAHGSITWCNAVAAALLGLRYPQDKGQLLVNIFRDPDFVQYFQRADFSEALKLRSARNSALYLRIEITEYGPGDRLLLVRDITQVNRLESMRVDFVANVSHELRTPLTVINGYLETLRGMDDDSIPPPILDRALGQMQSQSGRMEALVNDLTTLSRLESQAEARETGQVIDVSKLVSRLIDEAPGEQGKDKHVYADVAAGCYLLGQQKEIHSAFGNLINNAYKYTGPQGQVFIEWRVEAGRAVFTVRDDGEGIAPEHIPRLTERFYRVDKSRSVNTGGTGLGLAIVKHVLMRHQASLDIESEPGQGSCFRCVFPLHRIQLR